MLGKWGERGGYRGAPSPGQGPLLGAGRGPWKKGRCGRALMPRSKEREVGVSDLRGRDKSRSDLFSSDSGGQEVSPVSAG